MNTVNFRKSSESYWIASTAKKDYPPLKEDIKVDIAIVGGGMVGVTTAYQLRNEELNIAILEADNLLSSTTAHTTGKLTSQHSLIYDKIKSQRGKELARQYADANEAAIKEVKRIADEHGIDCDYLSESAYIYTEDDKYIGKIKDEVEAASSLGIKASYIEDIPFDIAIKAGVKFENQAQFHPRKFLLGLADIIDNDGVAIYEDSRVVNMEEDEGDYLLMTSQGKKVRARKVIIASHYPFYNKPSMYYARIYVERSYILAIKAKEKYPSGMYINAEEPSRSLRNQDTKDGELILVVGETHKSGQGEDTSIHYENLLNFASQLFTIEDVPYRWSTQDCMTVDGVPYIGYYTDDSPNLYIATGFQKWGMTNSIVSAMILKDLIVEGESPWQDVYNPSRKTITASAKELISQGVNVAGQLIDGKLSKLPDELDLELGEAQVYKSDGERIGVFKDDEGKLHFVDTTCTHMGCELNWNSAEKSWDCPCHGSRFTYGGDIIQGPAVRPLNFGDDVNTLKKLIKEDF